MYLKREILKWKMESTISMLASVIFWLLVITSFQYFIFREFAMNRSFIWRRGRSIARKALPRKSLTLSDML